MASASSDALCSVCQGLHILLQAKPCNYHASEQVSEITPKTSFPAALCADFSSVLYLSPEIAQTAGYFFQADYGQTFRAVRRYRSESQPCETL